MQNLIFSANVVAPIFLIIFIGYFLKRKGLIDDRYNSLSSKIVFNVAMPSLVFSKIATSQISNLINYRQIGFVFSCLLVIFALVWLVAKLICKSGRDQGAFIQGSVRSNFAIIGFALINNTFGPQALANAAIVLAAIMPLYNVLSIVALTVPIHREKQVKASKIAFSIVTNPLIIASIGAILFSLFNIHLHVIFARTITYLAAMTLPMALLSIGGSLSFESIKNDFKLSVTSALIKIVINPILVVYFAYLLGFRKIELGVIYFLFAAPTAIASYIMAGALGSNGKLAGHIILVTTLGSMITLTIGIFIMRTFGLF